MKYRKTWRVDINGNINNYYYVIFVFQHIKRHTLDDVSCYLTPVTYWIEISNIQLKLLLSNIHIWIISIVLTMRYMILNWKMSNVKWYHFEEKIWYLWSTLFSYWMMYFWQIKSCSTTKHCSYLFDNSVFYLVQFHSDRRLTYLKLFIGIHSHNSITTLK